MVYFYAFTLAALACFGLIQQGEATYNRDGNYTIFSPKTAIPYCLDTAYSSLAEQNAFTWAFGNFTQQIIGGSQCINFQAYQTCPTSYHIKFTPLVGAPGSSKQPYSWAYPGNYTGALDPTTKMVVGMKEQLTSIVQGPDTYNTYCSTTPRCIMRWLATLLSLRNEHQRPDREQYITVNTANVAVAAAYNQTIYNAVPGSPTADWLTIPNLLFNNPSPAYYDYCSITHNVPTDFAVKDATTGQLKQAFTLKNGGSLPNLGAKLSYVDCVTINVLYGCGSLAAARSACAPDVCSMASTTMATTSTTPAGTTTTIAGVTTTMPGATTTTAPGTTTTVAGATTTMPGATTTTVAGATTTTMAGATTTTMPGATTTTMPGATTTTIAGATTTTAAGATTTTVAGATTTTVPGATTTTAPGATTTTVAGATTTTVAGATTTTVAGATTTTVAGATTTTVAGATTTTAPGATTTTGSTTTAMSTTTTATTSTTTVPCPNFCAAPLAFDEIGTLGDGRHFMFKGACAQEIDSTNFLVGSPVPITTILGPSITSVTGGTVWSDQINQATYVQVGSSKYTCASGSCLAPTTITPPIKKVFEYVGAGATFTYNMDAPTASANFQKLPSGPPVLESSVQCQAGAPPAAACSGQPITGGWSFGYDVKISRSTHAVNIVGPSATPSGFAIQTMTQTTLGNDATWVFDTTQSIDLAVAMGCGGSG